MPLKKYDWPKVEQAFVSAPDGGRMTLKAISERFGIPYQTVRRYAAQHNWTLRQLNVIIPHLLRESLTRTNNPHTRASILQELKQYEAGVYVLDTKKC